MSNNAAKYEVLIKQYLRSIPDISGTAVMPRSFVRKIPFWCGSCIEIRVLCLISNLSGFLVARNFIMK